MVILEKIKEYSYQIATFHGLGKWKFGHLLGSLFAFPVLLLGRFLFAVSCSVSFWFLFLFFIASLLIIYFALNFISTNYSDDIVLDKVIGLMITFAYIPLRLKLILFGFIFFHIINFLRPFILPKKLTEQVNSLPMSFEILLGDVIAGLICNVFLQLIFWIMV